MKPLHSHLVGRLLTSDLLSGGLSAAVLAWRGRTDAHSAAAPINAVSHWLWPREALRQDGVSARFTATGLAVHFAAALLWCGLYERLRARQSAATPARAVTDAAVVSAVAAVVDLACVPHRLTPGFQERISPRSLLMVYGAFAAGLALAGLSALRR
ncbi:hypothetical protein [Pelomonas cellulosilytica]|uniref:Uncharacterized protein n=1 Tax=Pelomonas cellulosilytica TaxID=2906762 RepID=A0ABS8Y4H9_9BURK|nr:hypothetical protein [Pelomonas sp. P8]MCE4557085.1 hypothetical protein [Pelomonas sp. P8]